VTQPRLKVLAFFQASKVRHLSAEDVHHALQDEHIGLTTVYRVLSQLEAAGLLKRNSLHPDKAVYELDDGHHHDHLVCVSCGRIDEFQESMIERRQEEIAQMRGFRLVEHALCIYGICAECAK
jgi:Fur family ferric uptake transcriptional regulator